MYTDNNLVKEKLILMLQVRQVISLATSHPYLPFCRHIILILHFISIENIFDFYLLFIKLYTCNNVVLVIQTKRLEIYFSMLYLFLVLTLTKILKNKLLPTQISD